MPVRHAQPPRTGAARRRRCAARVQHLLVARDAVLGGARHRVSVLLHLRADVLLRQLGILRLPEQSPCGWPWRGRTERRPCSPRDADHLLPLGHLRVVRVRPDGPMPRLLRVPQETAADAALLPSSDHRRPHLRPHRPRRRPAGGVRYGVRGRDLTRTRRQADGRRARCPGGRTRRHFDACSCRR